MPLVPLRLGGTQGGHHAWVLRQFGRHFVAGALAGEVKKVLLAAMVLTLSLSAMTSCRDTKDKTEEAKETLNEAGEDLEEAAEDAADALKEAGKEAKEMGKKALDSIEKAGKETMDAAEKAIDSM